MKKVIFDKRYIGIILCLVFGKILEGVSIVGHEYLYLSGWAWYAYSSFWRLVLGIGVLIVGSKIFNKKISEILSFRNTKIALFASLGFILYYVMFVMCELAGIGCFKNLTVGLAVTHLFLQQITTGVFEEANNRFLVVEGFFYCKKTVVNQLIYTGISFILFGLIHVEFTNFNVDIFLFTGTVGFAFAVCYIKSRNILIPMLLHFTYDIFANLVNYIEWNGTQFFYVMGTIMDYSKIAMFVISLIILIFWNETDGKYRFCVPQNSKKSLPVGECERS